VFVLAFVVEFGIEYNPFIHKTQQQKLHFITFLSFLVVPHTKLHPHLKNKQYARYTWSVLKKKITNMA
jgi:hypothetical protein